MKAKSEEVMACKCGSENQKLFTVSQAKEEAYVPLAWDHLPV